MLETWFLFSLLSVAALTITELLQQSISNHEDSESNFSPMESLLFVLIFQTIILFIVSLFLSEKLNIFSYIDLSIWKLFFFLTFLNWFGDLYYFKAFQVKSLSLTSIFVGTSSVVAIFLGWLFMDEPIYFEKILGLVLILSSAVLVFWKSIYFERNHIFALVAAVFFGFLVVTDDFTVTKFSNIHPIIYMFWSTFLMLLVGVIIYYRKIIDKIKTTRVKKFRNIFISSMGYLIFNIAIIYAYKFGGEAGRIDAINNFGIFLVILVEYFFLKQKKDLWLKIASFVLSLIGVILLGMF